MNTKSLAKISPFMKISTRHGCWKIPRMTSSKWINQRRISHHDPRLLENPRVTVKMDKSWLYSGTKAIGELSKILPVEWTGQNNCRLSVLDVSGKDVNGIGWISALVTSLICRNLVFNWILSAKYILNLWVTKFIDILLVIDVFKC